MAKNLSTAFQAKINPLVNKIGVHKYQKDSRSLIYPMYLKPPSSNYQRASQNHVFISYLDHAVSSKLHLPINSLFQCFPHAPKLLSTLRLGEVSVWAKNLSMMFTIFSQKFLGKTPYNFVGNMGLYSVGKGMRKNTLKEH